MIREWRRYCEQQKMKGIKTVHFCKGSRLTGDSSRKRIGPQKRMKSLEQSIRFFAIGKNTMETLQKVDINSQEFYIENNAYFQQLY